MFVFSHMGAQPACSPATDINYRRDCIERKKRVYKIVFYKECIPSIKDKMLHYETYYFKH